ncbi:hypothetical protein JL108_06435 [Aeromicrobium sp. YIM 150415]|uniref:hypothetical protein n=1 Tax=Aeromicrobium sp. YIM 150415 TaxID=2803912 RepID=UPI001966C668|nr:hypothetical protein [Aeromicrobium sp. YIM 150415]MBM9463081.1 hypothetical protein [Aeromicrobium sp. YIM 150415]
MESQDAFDDDAAAREALASIEDVRAGIADRAAAPTGFYAYLGVGAALLTVSMAARGWQPVIFAVALAIVLSSVFWYRRSTGTWDFGNPFVREAWRYWLMIVPFAVGLIVAAITQSLVVATVFAVVTVLLWTVVGPQWDRDYRRALREAS